MTSILRLLRTYVEDGSISMTSHNVDDVDFVYSIEGFTFERDILKTLQVKSLLLRSVYL